MPAGASARAISRDQPPRSATSPTISDALIRSNVPRRNGSRHASAQMHIARPDV